VIVPKKGARIWKHGNSKGPPHPREENLRRISEVGKKRWKEESGYYRRSIGEKSNIVG